MDLSRKWFSIQEFHAWIHPTTPRLSSSQKEQFIEEEECDIDTVEIHVSCDDFLLTVIFFFIPLTIALTMKTVKYRTKFSIMSVMIHTFYADVFYVLSCFKKSV